MITAWTNTIISPTEIPRHCRILYSVTLVRIKANLWCPTTKETNKLILAVGKGRSASHYL